MKLRDMPRASLSDVDPAIALTYACRDADGTRRLAPQHKARLTAMKLDGVYRLELDTYHLIDRMMMIGMKPDLEKFEDLSWKLQGEIDVLQYRLEKEIGIAGFNANSGDQVAAYLYETLALPEAKRTDSGRGSTNDIILEGLEREYGFRYPAISTIREFRETYKLKNTFVDRIPDFVDRWPYDGRVHSTFRTTRVVTGRLAASDPNILAQPEHGKFAKYFKQGWIAEDGHVIGAWDESQLELRCLADLSRDPVLMEAYTYQCPHKRAWEPGTTCCDKDDCVLRVDLHARLAHRVFGLMPSQQDKSQHRLPAKSCNFGLAMGMQAQGLCLQLRKNGLLVDEDDAQEWIDGTNVLYKEVPRYKERMIAEARRTGMVRCRSGRIRYIGGMHSWDRAVKAEAERFSFSTPIQEYAQYIMKSTEANVWHELCKYRAEGLWVEPLVQVHDALKIEMTEGLQHKVNAMMRWAMIDSVQHLIAVPLGVEGEWGWTMAPMSAGEWSDSRGMRGF